MPDTAFMPRYQSHKIVSALEIASIDWTPNAISTAGQMQGGWTIVPADPGFGHINVDANFTARFMPKPGDFVVWYDDGYMSASPRKAFLEGYTRLNTSDSGVNAVPQPKDFRGVATEIKARADTSPQELRRWAVQQAISANYTDETIVTMAAMIERYVLDGEPAKVGGAVAQVLGQPGVQAGSTLGAAQQRAGEVWR